MSKKYTKNESVFENIDTEEKSYWLGFFSADGYVSDDGRVSLKLSTKDIDHLEKYKRFMEYTGPTEHLISRLGISIRKFGKQEFYETACVRIQSKKITHDLSKHGVFPRKSLSLTFPVTVPNDLIFHYLRGYVDGDGCWSNDNNKYCTTSLTICGTKYYLEKIEEIIYNSCNIRGRFRQPSKIHTLTYGGNNHIRTISYLLYKNSTLFLQRKFNKLIENSILDEHKNIIPEQKLDYIGNKNPNSKYYMFKSPTGEIFEVVGKLKKFCKEHKISYGGIINVANGKRENVDGWTAYKKVLTV